MKVTAIAGQKGGNGKSSLAHNIGSILAIEHEARVLLCDLDPQATLTQLLGIETDTAGMPELLASKEPIGEILVHKSPNLHAIASHPSLSQVERELESEYRREDTLKDKLATVYDDYDYCLIDCPPSRGLLVVNALSTSHNVLIPAIPQISDARALAIFFDTIDQVKQRINPHLEVLGVVLNCYDDRLIHHKSVKDEIATTDTLIDVQIGRSIRIAEAGIHGQSLLEFDPRNKQLDAYRQIAKVVKNG